MFKKRSSIICKAGTKRQRWLQIVACFGGCDAENDPRRATVRHSAQGYVTLAYDDDGTPHSRMINLLEVSAEGITAKGSNEMPLETPVVVEFMVEGEEDVFRLNGLVAHCTQTVGGYKIGITLDLTGDDDEPAQQSPAAGLGCNSERADG